VGEEGGGERRGDAVDTDGNRKNEKKKKENRMLGSDAAYAAEVEKLKSERAALTAQVAQCLNLNPKPSVLEPKP
jgi:hypothetical protein